MTGARVTRSFRDLAEEIARKYDESFRELAK